MLVTNKSRFHIRLQNVLFVILFFGILGVAGWLSTEYVYKADWTASHSNTLSKASKTLVSGLKGTLHITAFARREPELRKQIRDIVGRYQQVDPAITLSFVDPDAEPDRVRTLGITANGELHIEYQGRTQNVSTLDESSITNALQRVARSSTRWIVFLIGHGERKPHGTANFDLGNFGKQLKTKGFQTETLNLAENPKIPDNTAALVIAGPQTALLPGEVKIITDYVNDGGNLLWLGDPGPLYGLKPLADELGIQFLDGTVVDPTSRIFGINDPTAVLVAKYGSSPITHGFDQATLFPRAAGLDFHKKDDWNDTPFLQTLPRSWLETGKLEGEISFDAKAGDKQGPIAIGLSLTRDIKPPAPKGKVAVESEKPRTQRIAVIADGDFLSNAYLGNAGNLDLGLNLFNWLSDDDQYISVDVKSAPDVNLQLTPTAQGLISGGFLIALPLMLLFGGIMIWIRRRRR